MGKKVIAVVFGGVSTEHEVSKMSAATVLSGIPSDKYTCVPVYVSKEGQWFLYDGPIDNFRNIKWEKHGTRAILSPDTSDRGLFRIVSDKVKKINIDAVFPLIHGATGEDGSIQGLCKMAGITCVGCGVLASALCMDKSYTKIIVDSLKIPQATNFVTDLNESNSSIAKKMRYKIGYPAFVKPANTGSSVGISRVDKKEDLYEAIQLASAYDEKVIIEKAVIGRELECAVMGNDELIASPVGEILSANEFYDYEAKYSSKESKTVISPELPEGVEEQIQDYSKRIFKAMGCRGFARVDFFLEKDTNKVIFNEINSIPGFTSISMFPMLMEAAGYSLSSLIDWLISLAFEG